MKGNSFIIFFEVVFFILFIINYNSMQAQNPLPKKEFEKSNYTERIVELREIYGQNKKLPVEFELACLISLAYYPELSNVNIEFVYKNIATTMAARPTVSVLYRRKKNRTYRIFINTNSNIKGILLHEVPFNAQIGIVSHELAHIYDYENKNLLSLIKTGIGYFSKKFRSKLEKETDLEAVKRGFGWQVYAFSDFLNNKSKVSSIYIDSKKDIYYSPKDVLMLLREFKYEF